MIMVRHARILVPAIALVLIVVTLLHKNGTSTNNLFNRPVAPASIPALDDTVPRPYEEAANSISGVSIWTDTDIKALSASPYPKWTDPILDAPVPRAPAFHERARYESSEVWLHGDFMLPLGTGSDGIPRPKIPKKNDLPGAGQHLRQPILGDFKYGADKVFMMFKTSADTQWSRMPVHFMTSLTRAKNFAIYSDAAGSMFGHEIIDILTDLPPRVQEEVELERLRAHRQSHDEHWNWAPETLQSEEGMGWKCDRYKNIPMLYDAYQKNPNCDWYIWIDDDSFVFYDNMIKWLETMNPNELIYTGNPAGTDPPFAHGGSVAVVSHAVAEGLFGPEGKKKAKRKDAKDLLDHWADETIPVCCGDAMVAIMLIEELNVRLYEHPEFGRLKYFGNPWQREPLDGLIITKDDFCIPIVSFHHLNNHQIEMLWEYERLWTHDRFITHDDIYRDFYLPYVVKERPNWKIYDAGENPEVWTATSVAHDTGNIRPWESKEACIAVCEAGETCSGWSYKSGECHIARLGFNFGSAMNSWNKEEGWTSGYMVDRIREWRAASPCDPLQRDRNGNYNDDENTSEGWMIRRMENAPQRSPGAKSKDSVIPGRHSDIMSP